MDDEVKYANFVYEITCEIIVDRYYTDDELRRVFEKRIEANRQILDMVGTLILFIIYTYDALAAFRLRNNILRTSEQNRMLYEIDRLKRAINLSDLDLVCTRRTSGLPPSTPASVSSENTRN